MSRRVWERRNAPVVGIQVGGRARHRVARTGERRNGDGVDRAVLGSDDCQALVDRVVEGGLVHEPQRKNLDALIDDPRRAGRFGPGVAWVIRFDPARRKRAEHVVVSLQGDAKLLEVACALSSRAASRAD